MHNGILSESEIEDHNLDKDKLYVIKFLFNGSQNKAADPEPFKLGNLDALAEKAKGRPLVVPKWGDKLHVRSQKDTVEDQLQVQARYSVGEIVETTKSNNGNYYGIIEIWPEYAGMIRNNLIPDFTSPTIYVNKRDESGQIVDAEFLNVQAVPVPGYHPSVAGVNGLCDGKKDNCMRELRTLAAASKLSMIRQDSGKFSNMLQRIKGAMSMQAEPAQANNQDITKALEGLQSAVKGNTEALDMIGMKIKAHGEILVTLAENTEGVDIEDIREKLGGGEPANDQDATMTVGAAGDDETDNEKKTKGKDTEKPKRITSKDKLIAELTGKFKTLSKENEEIKKTLEAERIEKAKQHRLAQAKSIVEGLIKLKHIPETEREKKVQYYNELKDERENLIDLTLYANELTSIKPNIVASAGNEVLYRFPEPETKTSNTAIDAMREFNIIA